MITISKSREAASTIDRVWDVLSNLNEEQKYWEGLKDVKVLSRNENTIEREATISRGPLGNAKSLQTLVLEPKKAVRLTMRKGPMLGTRVITLIPLGENKTKIEVAWDFEMKGVPGFALGFVKDNISEGTDKALELIAKKAERTSLD